MRAEMVMDVITPAEADLPPDTIRFDFTGNDEELSQLLSDLVQQDILLLGFSEETGDLEDVFLQVTRGIVN